jgi:hypothetical protein
VKRKVNKQLDYNNNHYEYVASSLVAATIETDCLLEEKENAGVTALSSDQWHLYAILSQKSRRHQITIRRHFACNTNSYFFVKETQSIRISAQGG